MEIDLFFVREKVLAKQRSVVHIPGKDISLSTPSNFIYGIINHQINAINPSNGPEINQIEISLSSTVHTLKFVTYQLADVIRRFGTITNPNNRSKV